MYNALRVGFVSVGLWMVVRVMARFRLGFRSLVCHSIPFSMNRWVSGWQGWRSIVECVGEWVAVDLVVCDVVAVWVVQPSIVARTGVMLRFAILDWGRLVGVYCECWLVWLWDW